MSPDAAIEFLALSYVTTPETAQIRIAAARRAGATEAECAEAWTAWEQMRAGDVQQIQSQPTPRCMCSHKKHDGLCEVSVCGCKSYCPDDVRRPRYDKPRPPYLDTEEAHRRDAANDLSSPPASYDQTKRRVL